MKAQATIISSSRSKTILKCVVVALVISMIIITAGKANIKEFINNILEWESI